MRIWTVAAVIAFLLLSGCSHNETAKESVKNKEISKVEKPPKSKGEYPYYFPLTGKGSQTSTDGRAVAVMINNHPKARPQSGLNKADIVYEVLAEGDITRFLAVFQSEKPTNIGPVRSARDYYIELAKGLHALYVAHGSSPKAQEMMKSGYIDSLDGMVYDGTLFKRASFRKPPHNSYITYENILKGVKLKNYSMDQTPPAFKFYTEEESKNISGEDAASVTVNYYSNKSFQDTYQYDPSIGRYKRFAGGEQTIDLETKDPILLDNIFIVEMHHQVVDSSGHRAIDLTSGGNAYLLQKGKFNRVEWKNDNGRIIPVKDGKEVPFVQGKTWVNVIPTDPGLAKSVQLSVK
ncbi:MAG: DUF3048 domain-containing protein [Bacillota bacterium]|nr:DUF3048 domain-containing protein [Bacillota bacterium]